MMLPNPEERSRIEREIGAAVDHVLQVWSSRTPTAIEDFRALFHPSLTAVGTGRDELVRSDAESMIAFFGREMAELPEGFEVEEISRTTDVHGADSAHVLLEILITPRIDDPPPATYVRMSTGLIREASGRWLVSHWHASVPMAEQVEGVSFPIDAIKARAEALEREVAERTADLTRANRNLQIEAALERVRSRAMAMLKSADLLDIVVVMRDEFTGLGFEAGYFWHMRWLEDRYEKAMTSGDGTRIGMVMRLPRDFHATVGIGHWEDSGVPTAVFPFDADGAIDYVHRMVAQGEFDRIDPNAPTDDDIRHIGGITFVMARTTHGEIGYTLAGVAQPSAEALAVLARFAGAFDLAYRRFEDLRLAEAQAREARVEAALDRVRAHTLAMIGSHELGEVARIFDEQLLRLGIETRFSYLWLPDREAGRHAFWVTWDDGTGRATATKTEYDLDPEDPAIAKCLVEWESSVSVFCTPVAPAGYADYFGAWDEIVRDPVTGRARIGPEDFPDGLAYADAYMKYGSFGLVLPRATTEEENRILARFAREFERTYARFLELLEREARQREAEIEAALERVRSRAMGMHRPEDVRDVIEHLYAELKGLDDSLFFVGLYVFDPDTEVMTSWPQVPGQDRLESYKVPRFDHPFHDRAVEAFSKGSDSYVYELKGEEKKAYDAMLFSQSQWVQLPEGMKRMMREQPFVVSTNAAFRSCLLEAASTAPLSPASTQLLERFVRTVDLAMTRYEDLRAAAAAAREARIEASMERVRARAMAMMEPEELDDVVNLLRDEFGRLGLEDLETASLFLREEEAAARCWFCIAASDGRISDDILIEFDRTNVCRAIGSFLDGSDPRVSIPMAGADRREWIEYCYALSSKLSGFYGGEIPDRTYHLRRFSMGAIGAATPGELSEESWDVLRRGAGVFELAYSRFQDLLRAREDLRLLKEEKALTERTLAELRATQAQLVEQEKLASLGSLTAGIAHEIKNPLNFVNNFAEVNAELAEEAREALASGDLAAANQALADLEENAAQIAKHGKRADSIVKAMMQHARGGTSERETIVVNDFLEEYAALAWHGMRARDDGFKAELVRDFASDTGSLRVMPQELGRVVLNLLGNAFDALKSTHGARVTLSSRRTATGVEITVADNGPGIKPDIREKIFEPFFTTKPTGEGTGLGLSLSYDIVTKGHGGAMTVGESADGGALFSITLPSANA